MKKISIILSVVLLALTFNFISPKAAELKLNGYQKINEGTNITPNYYVIEVQVQDDSNYEPDFYQIINSLKKMGKTNESYFTNKNVQQVLQTDFNLDCTPEVALFLAEVIEKGSHEYAIRILIQMNSSCEYSDLTEVAGNCYDIYLMKSEKLPIICSPDDVHIINYDNNITLDMIKSTYTAYDNYDEDITDEIIFESNYPSDPKKAKIDEEYYIKAIVYDSSGNKAEVTNKIEVKDITAPKFSKETLSYEINYGDAISINNIYADLTCTDNYEGTIPSSSWKHEGEIDLHDLDPQTIIISYTDKSNNTGKCSVTIKINDISAPIISVSPIELSTTNPLTEEEILALLESSGKIEGGYISYDMSTEYFNNQDKVGSHDVTLSLDYEDGQTKHYRFTINVLENLNNQISNNDNNWYIYVIIAVSTAGIIGLVAYLIYRKKKIEV